MKDHKLRVFTKNSKMAVPFGLRPLGAILAYEAYVYEGQDVDPRMDRKWVPHRQEVGLTWTGSGVRPALFILP